MKTKDYVSKARIFCSLAMLTALILLVSPYLSEGAVVEVDDVEELYAEVNNPNNAGATIRLAAGIYKLSSLDPNGVARPNQGRLILPFGTSLEGHNEYVDYDGDGISDPRDDNEDGVPDLDVNGRKIFEDPATATVIDATGLTVSSMVGFIVVNSVPNSSVTTFQSIKKLTLWGNQTPRAGIIVQAAANGSLNMTLENCTVGLLSRGIQVDARLMPINGDNSTLDVTLEGNVFCYNNHLNSLFGLGVQSAVARVTNHTTHMRVRDNRFFANGLNLNLLNFGPKHSKQIVRSENNIYEESQLIQGSELISSGIFIVMGGTKSPAGVVDKTNDNLTKFNSKGDKVWSNEGATFNEEDLFAGGGLYVSFGRLDENAEFHNNEIEIELEDTLFIKRKADGTFDGPQNRGVNITDPTAMKRRDISIVGLTNVVEALPELTTGNRIKIEVKGAISSLAPTAYDPNPQTFQVIDNAPNGVDITIKGTPEEFLNENTGLNLPDESLFSGE